MKDVHRTIRATQKIRPRKILARRPEELLCEVELNEVVDVTWEEEERVEVSQGCESSEPEDTGLPLVGDMEEWLTPPFTQE